MTYLFLFVIKLGRICDNFLSVLQIVKGGNISFLESLDLNFIYVIAFIYRFYLWKDFRRKMVRAFYEKEVSKHL